MAVRGQAFQGANMKKPLLATFLLAAVSTPAAAVTGTVTFSGVVTETCTINVDSPGTLVANTDLTTLSTNEAGGTAGVATIQTTGSSFSVSAAAPAVFTSAPAGGDENVTFATLYSATGATNLADVVGDTPSALAQGTTTLSVDLTATKSSGSFPAGNYTADVVVTCE